MRTLVKHALAGGRAGDELVVKGWVRTRRDAKGFSFLELNDGSCLAGLQVVVDHAVPGAGDLARMGTGAAVEAAGELVASPGQGQQWELRAARVALVGPAPDDYPLQKKGHSAEFLRSIGHLRPRTNLYGAMFRIRSRMAFAVHRFFRERDFVLVHTPIITSSDCEGAGEMFRVTTLDPAAPAAQSFADDFFGRAAFLTVSGQLEAEAFACALSNVYTFGPTFRAENSNTSRHAAEFWMIEPEMAFCDLAGDMELAEQFVRELVREALEGQEGDLEVFERFVDKGLRARLESVAGQPFERIAYADAVRLLEASGRRFEHPVGHGLNLQSEHERFLTEECFRKPVTVYNYPKQIKPFYMRLNDDDATVTAMDLLVPGIGEIVGGSQREERLEVLEDNLRRHQMDAADDHWYLDLRRYGGVPHAGFGAGFERLLMFVTGMPNIRDVTAFARTPGNCAF